MVKNIKVQSCISSMMALFTVDQQMRVRLEWSGVDLMRSIIVFLDTQSWQDSEESSKDDRMSEIKSAVVSLTEVFRAPLEVKGADLSSILDEVEDIVEYAWAYLRVESNTYKKIWYQLRTTPDSVKWHNVIQLCELLFSLPFSTAKVERLFSSLKVVKNEKRTNLNCSTLNDLLEVKTEGPSVNNFSADAAMELWWKDSTGRRVNQNHLKLN